MPAHISIKLKHEVSGVEMTSQKAGRREIATSALRRLYGHDQESFGGLMDNIEQLLEKAERERPEHLRQVDVLRASNPQWFLQPGRVAYCTYIDKFAGTLSGCIERIPYLRDLGVGLFHPLPLLKPREGDNDGGFAVADYAAVDPKLGTFDDLKALAFALRQQDMSLVLDVVCNHTAREHAWATAMLAGHPDFKDFYIVLKSEEEVREWSAALVDVFPDTAPGSFTFDEDAGGWVWTTFYSYQWDLNYANPRVFLAMLDVLLQLANAGVEGFRLDSAAFLWKVKGTISRNLPQAHDILLAFRNLLAIVAPGVFLLAEAIEGLDDVLGYFGEDIERSECDLAYNNTMMTALWGSLADGDARVASKALDLMASKPSHGAWLNYVRCHDDIIWQALAPWNEQSRLQGWSDFYAGRGTSFANGRAFQAPVGLAPSTCGMAASLCGDGPLARARLKLLYGVTLSLDGVPMVYMGDEIALKNDDSFAVDPEKAKELRWLHRPDMDWNQADGRHSAGTSSGDIFTYLRGLRRLQSSTHWWNGLGPAAAMHSDDKRVLMFRRTSSQGTLVCKANFSPDSVMLGGEQYDLTTQSRVSSLSPYQMIWSYTE